jgi:hypothetical protein
MTPLSAAVCVTLVVAAMAAVSPLKRSWHKEDNLVIPSTRDKPLDLDVGEFLPVRAAFERGMLGC